MRTFFWFSVMFVCGITASAMAKDVSITPEDVQGGKPSYSPFVDKHYPNRVFWGDTHVHTSNSPDAGMVGNTLSPTEAYRFARGEEVTSSTGVRVKLVRPLDFLVVADHSEYLGLAPMLQRGDEALLSDSFGKRLYEAYKAGGEEAYKAFLEIIDSVTRGELLIENPEILRAVWEENNAAADEYNAPGSFTAFIGYEWSSLVDGNNLHRVLVFRDDAEKANQVVPFSSMDSPDPEDLWKYMNAYERDTGGRVLAIPHNGNLSNGIMFPEVKSDGSPIDAEYTKTRTRFEPIL